MLHGHRQGEKSLQTPPRRREQAFLRRDAAMAGTPKSELPEAWRELATRGAKRDPLRNLDARAKVFLDRIAHLSADLDSHGRTRANALKNCAESARPRLKASPHPGHGQVLPFKVPRRHPPDRPKLPGLVPQKNALRPALQLPCASPDAQIGAGATGLLDTSHLYVAVPHRGSQAAKILVYTPNR